MTQLYAGLGIVALLIGGVALLAMLNRSAGRNEARLKADESTLNQVQTGNDVAREVDRMPDAAVHDGLRKWERG